MPVVELADLLAEAGRGPAMGTGVRLIGIDGPSGSGKSTLARRLAALSGAPIVEIDDFVSWTDVTGWWPRFDREVLTPLLAGRTATYQVRDWQHDEFGTSLGPWKTAEPAPLMILEGVSCTRQAATARLSYRIWVEAPRELRLRRGHRRDAHATDAHWQRWMDDEAAFFAADRTRERADLRVVGNPTEPYDPETQLVQAARQPNRDGPARAR